MARPIYKTGLTANYVRAPTSTRNSPTSRDEASSVTDRRTQGEDFVIERLGLLVPASDPMLPGIKQHEEDLAKLRRPRTTSGPSNHEPPPFAASTTTDRNLKLLEEIMANQERAPSAELQAKRAKLLQILAADKKGA